jgi:hypothetical protein
MGSREVIDETNKYDFVQHQKPSCNTIMMVVTANELLIRVIFKKQKNEYLSRIMVQY